MYSDWDEKEGFQIRDAEGISQKLDLLASEKKKTGNPVCEHEYRRAMTLAQSILGQVQAIAIVFDSSKECQSDGTMDLTGDNPNLRRTSKKSDKSRVGVRHNRRASGACGIRSSKNSTEEALLACLTSVADKFGIIADAGTLGSQDNVEQLVHRDV